MLNSDDRQHPGHSRLVCPYCAAAATPNSLYCMECGQILSPPTETLGIRHEPVAAATPVPQLRDALPRAPQHPAAPWGEPGTVAAPAPPAPPAVAAPDQPAVAKESAAELPPTGLQARTHGSVTLAFGTGHTVRIARGAIIGRKPEATARNAGLEAVEIDDAAMSLSRAHARVDVTARTVRLTDLGSSNGTEIERAGEQFALEPDRPSTLRSGDRVWLGNLWADVVVELHTERESRGETTGH